MNVNTTRRRFIRQLGGLGIGATLASRLRAAVDNNAPLFEIGLSQYSLRELFSNNKLNVLDYPAFARRIFGIQLIDIWEGGIPTNRKHDPQFYRQLRARAIDAGTRIFLFMIGAVDARDDAAKQRHAHETYFQPSIDSAQLLGCEFVRIFLRAPDASSAEAVKQSVNALAPLADYAQKKEVTLVIEPGASTLTKQGPWLAELMKTLDHPHCRLMPDFGKLGAEHVVEGVTAMMPYTAVISAKSHNFDSQGNETEFDYYRLMKIAVDAGFHGIAAIEYEGKALTPVEGVQATQRLLQQVRNRLQPG